LEFESFYAKEWVQVSTAFVFVVIVLLTPVMYWGVSRNLKGNTKEKFIEAAFDIYGVVFFLLVAPAGYLGLYFLGSQSKFMLNDPMAWVCFLGGAASVYDLIRVRLALGSAKVSAGCTARIESILMFEKLAKLAFCLSLIPLIYGGVMIGVTNLIDPSSISNMLWFLTFMMTGLAVVYSVASKTLLLVSQAYASNPELGC